MGFCWQRIFPFWVSLHQKVKKKKIIKNKNKKKKKIKDLEQSVNSFAVLPFYQQPLAFSTFTKNVEKKKKMQ